MRSFSFDNRSGRARLSHRATRRPAWPSDTRFILLVAIALVLLAYLRRMI